MGPNFQFLGPNTQCGTNSDPCRVSLDSIWLPRSCRICIFERQFCCISINFAEVCTLNHWLPGKLLVSNGGILMLAMLILKGYPPRDTSCTTNHTRHRSVHWMHSTIDRYHLLSKQKLISSFWIQLETRCSVFTVKCG